MRSKKGRKKHLKRSVLILISVILAAAFVLIYLSQSKRVLIKIGTGPAGGGMVKAAGLVKDVWDTKISNLDIRLVDVDGTLDNLDRLRTNNKIPIDLAVVTEVPREVHTDNSDIRSIARVFINPLEVIASRESKIKKIGDIKPGHRVALPPESTGSARRVEVILKHYGLTEESGIVFIKSNTITDVVDKLISGSADVGFMGGAIPLPAMQDNLKVLAKNFVFVEVEFADAIEKNYPPLFAYKIPSAIYTGSPPFPESDILTVASYATLVGRSDFEDRAGSKLTYELTASMFTYKSFFQENLPAMQQMNEESSKLGSGYPLFKGATNYYNRNQPFNWDPLVFYVTFSAFLFSILLVVVDIYSKRERLVRNTTSSNKRIRKHS